MILNILINISILLCCILTLTNTTISPPGKNKFKNKTKTIAIKSGPVHQNVFERQLIEHEPSGRDILVENGAYYHLTRHRLFNGTVLGYVTPWNNHGYDVAKIWSPKFSMISPVWFQIIRLSSGIYEIKGEHDVDSNWINDVRTAASFKNKILPRLLFDKFTDNDFLKLLTYDKEKNLAIQLIIDTCLKHNFDGIVLELWSQLAARVEDKNLMLFVMEIARKLKQQNLEIILVVPALRKEMYDLFTHYHFETLWPFITAFSLMTYDFSSIQRPGANAPLYWMKEAVEHICPENSPYYQERRKKILLGLNLYGNDYTPEGGGPIVGKTFLEMLKYLKGRLRLDENNLENFFEIKTHTGRHVIFYPTLYSINERIKLARELGTGVSLWELGQGLDYFYDLF